jgi:hypothetical protein
LTLGAPGNKPYVLRLVLDQETGLVLRYAAEGTPYVVEVLDFTVDADLSPATFMWDGDVEDAAGADEHGEPPSDLEGLERPDLSQAVVLGADEESTGERQDRIHRSFGISPHHRDEGLRTCRGARGRSRPRLAHHLVVTQVLVADEHVGQRNHL